MYIQRSVTGYEWLRLSWLISRVRTRFNNNDIQLLIGVFPPTF